MFTSLLTYTLLAPATVALAIVTLTYVFTYVRYRISLWQSQSHASKKAIRPPIKIPYAFPGLGNALDFLRDRPGSFWTDVFRWYPHTAGPFTLKLGGRSTHIIYDPHTIQALFKARSVSRHGVNMDILTKAFGVDPAQAEHFYGYKEPPLEMFHGRTPSGEVEHIWTNFLIRTDRVNELSDTFMRLLQDEFSSDLKKQNTVEVGLYSWLRPRMFNASTIAFFGSKLLEDYPTLEQDFFDWECILLTCYFGIPRWLAPKVYALRDKLTEGMTKWQDNNIERSKGQVTDPEGDAAWEPIWGSRANRSRQIFYDLRGSLTTRTRALLDLGFMFGISSNSTPATGWMLYHILDPSPSNKQLYPRVMEAINSSKRSNDNSIDISLLMNQPLLLSLLHEVFRFYSDFLVTRELPKDEDLTLPVGNSTDNKKVVLLPRGGTVIAPGWIQHRDESFWTESGPSPHTFHAERFLTTDPNDTNKQVFSTAGTAGQFFPFGGGKSICPGRVFAKQEILASVAMILLEFEFEVLGYLDADGKGTERFPGVRDAYPGTALFTMSGDFKVRIKNKRKD